mgnify:CR=1 FL=1
MKASDIMTREVITIRGAAPVARAIQVMGQRNVRSLIVDRLHAEDAYGIVTETDIIYKVAAFGKDPEQVRVYEIMTKPCVVVNPDLQVEYVARLFLNNGIRAAPVISGTLQGLISMGDILAKGDLVKNPQMRLLEDKIAAAIDRARTLCDQPGADPQNCITAWQLVEDLQAEAAHQRSQPLEKTAFEQYREEFPEWLNAEDLDMWCSG